MNGTTVLESVARKYGRYTYYKVFDIYNLLVYYFNCGAPDLFLLATPFTTGLSAL